MNINKKLATRTLISMAGRIAAVVSLVAIVGYFHLKNTIIERTKGTLADYVSERGARERILFSESKRTHLFLIEEFTKSYATFAKDPALKAKFTQLTALNGDQVIRSRTHGFDGKKLPGIFLNTPRVPDRSLMAKTLAAFEVSGKFGPAFHHTFQDTYFTFPENGIVLYWPEFPNWVFDAKNTLQFAREEYYSVATPEKNPSKGFVWTAQFYDKVSRVWMVTASTPIYIDGQFAGSVHHDIVTNQIVERTLKDHLKDTTNYIVRSDGMLIAHPDFQAQIEQYDGKLDISNEGNPKLNEEFDLVSQVLIEPKNNVYESSDSYLAVAFFNGPNWFFVTKLPKTVIQRAAWDKIGFVLGGGLFSLVMELIIFFFVLKRQVTQPLLELVSATEKIAGGNLTSGIEVHREDELGLLARSFNKMTDAIRQRDEILEQHTVDLEKLVKERTRELDHQKAITLESSRLSALGEMAGGIAHEINTPLATIKLIASQAKFQIQDDIPDLDKVVDGLVRIDRTVDRVAKIIRGLKSFSRDGSHDEFETVPLYSIIEDTVSLCSERFRLHGVTFNVSPVVIELSIDCRSVQLCQVLLNLLNNAYDAIEGLSEKWIKLEVLELNQMIEIRVMDSGKGLAPEVVGKIFDPFFTTKAIGKGTGMGLSISHGIIKGHGGRLFLDLRLSNTCFVIQIPKRVPAVA